MIDQIDQRGRRYIVLLPAFQKGLALAGFHPGRIYVVPALQVFKKFRPGRPDLSFQDLAELAAFLA